MDAIKRVRSICAISPYDETKRKDSRVEEERGEEELEGERR